MNKSDNSRLVSRGYNLLFKPVAVLVLALIIFALFEDTAIRYYFSNSVSGSNATWRLKQIRLGSEAVF